MSKIQFRNAAHRDFVLENLDKCKVNDCYHRAFFYVMGISEETRMNIGKMFDFKRDSAVLLYEFQKIISFRKVRSDCVASSQICFVILKFLFFKPVTEYYLLFVHSFLPLSFFYGDCLTWLLGCDLSFAINNRELLLL